jgi:UDP-glucose:(heptosyl)LPS alpha-1,3-glucosyltransferase
LKQLLLALAERRKVNRAGRRIHLLICGSGEPGPYKRLARRLGVDETIHFLGFYPDIRACYHSSDFFAQPTYYDPCSLVVLEALACGLPVITTAQNGASELMVDGRHGFTLTAPDARGELIAALGQMTDDIKRREMASQATRLGKEQTFAAHVARLTAVFEEVASAKSRHTPHSQKRGSKSHTPHGKHSRKARRRN